MLKALKVTMIVWGILGILFGLAFIFIPQQLGGSRIMGATTRDTRGAGTA